MENQTIFDSINSLTQKIIILKICQNLERSQHRHGLTGSRLSAGAGKHLKAFSKTCAQLQDMRVLTFLSYLTSLRREAPQQGFRLDEILDQEVWDIMALRMDWADGVALADNPVFVGLEVHVEALRKKHRLTDLEDAAYAQMRGGETP